MQQTSQNRSSALVALGAVLALVAGVFMAAPAYAAPTDTTSHIVDGGDGVLNVNEWTAVMVTGTWDTASAEPIDTVRARIVGSATCDAAALTTTAAQDAVLDPGGTWEAGPFDLEAAGFVDGMTVCAKSRSYSGGVISANSGDSDNQPVIDLTVPEILIFTVDTDGTIGIDEVANGVDIDFETSTDATSVELTVANDASPAPAECTFSDLGTGPGELTVGATCFDVLADGAISFTLSAANDIGATVSESVAASLDRTLELSILDDFGNGSGAATGIANSAETENGAALKVLFDIDPALGDEVVSASVAVTDSDGNVATSDADPDTVGDQPFLMAATSSTDTRTVPVDVTSLVGGGLTAVGTILRGDNITTHTAEDTTILDIEGPQVTWTTEDGTLSIGVCERIIGFCTGTSLEGTATDTGLTSGVQFVYITGRNLDTGDTYRAPAPIATRDAAQTDWKVNANLETGTWELQAQSMDLAGNLGAPVGLGLTVIRPID